MSNRRKNEIFSFTPVTLKAWLFFMILDLMRVDVGSSGSRMKLRAISSWFKTDCGPIRSVQANFQRFETEVAKRLMNKCDDTDAIDNQCS